MPPKVDVLMTVLDGCVPCPHDTGGILLQLGIDSAELLKKAQEASGEQRVSLLQGGLELRLRERAGWLAVRTPEHPTGDLLAAAKAAAGIGVFYLKLFAIEDAREWFRRALIECPAHAQFVRESVQYNLDTLERIALERYVHRRVRVQGLVAQPQYNGRCGIVLCHKQERWEVLLEPENEEQPRLLRVRQQNIELV